LNKVRRNFAWSLGLGCLFLSVSLSLYAADATVDARQAALKPILRGGIVYKAYCVVCHGEIGDGVSRATQLYTAEQLRIRANLTRDEYEVIIRRGGEAIGRSPYMPPWQEELSTEQLSDVISYLAIVNQQNTRGRVVYQTNCILCHGVNHDGKGRAAVLYTPKPSDLIHSDKNEAYKRSIVSLGGKAMGRSPVMPPWGLQLTNQEIDDVVQYLGTILEPR